MRKFVSVVVASALFLSGCMLVPVYKPQIQQGNVITDDMLAKVHTGMSESQVRYLMGSPVLINIFSTNHWDYIYTLQKGGCFKHRQRISLTFCNGKLVNVQRYYRFNDIS